MFNRFQLKSAWKCGRSSQKSYKIGQLLVYACLFDRFQLKSTWKWGRSSVKCPNCLATSVFSTQIWLEMMPIKQISTQISPQNDRNETDPALWYSQILKYGVKSSTTSNCTAIFFTCLTATPCKLAFSPQSASNQVNAHSIYLPSYLLVCLQMWIFGTLPLKQYWILTIWCTSNGMQVNAHLQHLLVLYQTGTLVANGKKFSRIVYKYYYV